MAGFNSDRFDIPLLAEEMLRVEIDVDFKKQLTIDVQTIFHKIGRKYQKALKEGEEKFLDGSWLKQNIAFSGEVWMGHLRYGTHGKNSIENCHPFLRQNNWRSRNLVVAGNFNMTNSKELFESLVEIGQHPKEYTDTVIIMEEIIHKLFS